MTNNGNLTSYTYDLNNRLLQEVSGDEYTFYNYDNKGNLYSKRTDERSTAGNLTRVDTFGALKDNVNSTVELYSYDGLNRLNEVRKGGITAQYTYNAEGIRTSKTVNGITTEFLLDGANVVAETKNGSTTNYIRGVTGIISSSIQGTNNTTKYYTSDGHGNITKLTDSTGTIVKTYVYDAFGVEQNIDSNDTNPFRYCGEYYDSEIGQIYLRARYYDPSLGRFTQSDPAMANGMNWYSYCGNNPINFIDPSGLIIVFKNGEGVEYIQLLTGDMGHQINDKGELYYDEEKSEITENGSETATNLINALMEADEILVIDMNANFMGKNPENTDVGGKYTGNFIQIDNRSASENEVAATLAHEMVHAFSDFYSLDNGILMSFDSSLSEGEKATLSDFIKLKYNEAIAVTVEVAVRSELGWCERDPASGMIGVNDYGQFPWALTNNPAELDEAGNPIYGKAKAATFKSIGSGIVHYINSEVWRK